MAEKTPKAHKNRFIHSDYLIQSDGRSSNHSNEQSSDTKRKQSNTKSTKSNNTRSQSKFKASKPVISNEQSKVHSTPHSKNRAQKKNNQSEMGSKSKKEVVFQNINRSKKAKEDVEEIFEEEHHSASDEKVAQLLFNSGKKTIAAGYKKVKKNSKLSKSNTSPSPKKEKVQNTVNLQSKNLYKSGKNAVSEVYKQVKNRDKTGKSNTSTSSKKKNTVVSNQSKTSSLNGESKKSLHRNKSSSAASTSKKAQQKKRYQKSYHYKKGKNVISTKSNATKSGKAIQAIKALGSSISSVLSSKIAIVGGVVILVVVALYLLVIILFGMLGSSLDSVYLFTPSQATVIEQRYTDKELDYLDKIVDEADKVSGDFNTTINYDPVGHDPHEILSLFNILFIYDMASNEEEEYSFDLKKVDAIIEDLIEARYTFKKDVEEVKRTVTVENEDGTTSQKSITTTITTLTSTTQSINNIIGGASYNTPANTSEFIHSIGEDAREIASKNDIYASVMIAQAILETGSGGSDLGKPPYFNLFGIKGSYNGDSVTMYTKEDDGTGNQYTISSRFRDYPSYKESLSDYAIVMREQPSPGFYAPTYKSNTSSYRDATNYLTGTYATDTQYGTKLNTIIQQNNLTDYDTAGATNSDGSNPASEDNEVVEKTISGNIFSLTEYEQELYERTLQQRGLMGGYSSPIEGFDWGAKITEPYGLSWNEDNGKRYKTDGLLLNVGSGKNVQSQITGKVTKVTEKNGLATVAISSADTITFEYSNLKNINVSKGEKVKKGQTIGKTTSDGLLLNASDSKGKEINPQIIMYTETLKPTMYDADISSINSNITPSGNNKLNQNMAGKSYDDVDVQQLFNIAKQYIGYPYVFGGSSPSSSFDCSGFIYWVYKEAGLKNWSRTTANELYYSHSAPITEAEARPGDLVFFKNTYNAGVPITHVGIYAGDGIMLHAGNPIGFTSFKTSYWQSHQPTFGRLTQD